MRVHEQIFAETLARYREEHDGAALETWMQYTPEVALPEVEIRPGMEFDEVLAIGMRIDQTVAELYRFTAENTNTPSTKELFESLVEMEEARSKEISKTALGFQHELLEDAADG